MLIIDEVSMVKSDFLYLLDLRLQELKQNNKPFGGVSILAFGDFCQLRPVKGRFVFEVPINKDFRTTNNFGSRWDMFQCVELVKNHRQGKDHEYADLLNRARTGDHTKEDMELLKSRVRPPGHPDLENASLYIIPTKKPCAIMNDIYIKKLTGEMITATAYHHHNLNKKFKPRLDPVDDTVGGTGFVNELKIKIGAQIMLIYNVNTIDGLTNGQLGVVKHVIRDKNGILDKIIIKFKNPKAGKENRDKFKKILKDYPECSVIERVSMQYQLRDKNDVGASAKVIQFPIKLSMATTAHKVQGLTIPSPSIVVVDIQKCFEASQAYVMLSRVQCIEQIYILGDFMESKIKASPAGQRELTRLHKISKNNNPTPWEQDGRTIIKIAAFNCRGMVADKRFKSAVSTDDKLWIGNIVHLSEISLNKDMDTVGRQIEGYGAHFCLVGKGKGMATYVRNLFEHAEDIIEDNLQITKFTSDEVDSISCYRSGGKSIPDTAQKIGILINLEKPTVITGINICQFCILNNNFFFTGDFNVSADTSNGITAFLEKLGFQQLVFEPTHIGGNILDHVYWRDPTGAWNPPDVARYAAYYSDHDATLVTLKMR